MFSFDPKDFKFKVFFDLDGVKANFQGGIEKQFGGPYEKFHPDFIWETIGSNPNWFFELEKLEGADELWELISPFSPTALTGCPREPHFQQAADAKTRWVHQHFGAHVPVIACMSWRKQEYMTQPGDILIDDNPDIIARWRKAGGTGILFVNAAQAIEEFYNAVEALATL